MDANEKRDKRQRKEERVSATLPVNLGTAKVITKDVSASGIFFETDAAYAIDSTISFTVELNTPGGKRLLKCRGSIVRVERRGEKVGVAVKITESTLEAVQ
ncbi:MAG: PilZ domain-containing protein [Acidobacteriota bacterium]